MSVMQTTHRAEHNNAWLPAGMLVEVILLTGTGNVTGGHPRDERVSDGLWLRVMHPGRQQHGQAKFPRKLARMALSAPPADPDEAAEAAAMVTEWQTSALAGLGIDIADLRSKR